MSKFEQKRRTKNYELKTSEFQQALIIRTCPNDDVLYSEKVDRNLQKHLRQCDLCQSRKKLKKYYTEWKTIAEKIKTKYEAKRSKNVVKIPLVGQIRSLSIELNGWGDNNRYFKSPIVLLLELIHQEMKQKFRVAQIYSDRSMMDHKDVWLGEEYGFAESWNIYTVPVDYLANYCGEVSGQLVQKVKESERMPEYPDIIWNRNYLHFRNLEKDVADFFIKRMEAKVADPVRSAKDLFKKFKIYIQNISKVINDSIVWLPGSGGPGEGELVYLQAAASDVPPQSKTFPLGSGVVNISIHWVPAYRKAPALFTVHWEKDFVSADELWLRFVDHQKDVVRKDINLGASLEGEKSFDSGELGFDPAKEEWTIHVALVPPSKIAEGIEAVALKEQPPLLILSDQGLRKLAAYFAPELTPESDRTNKKAAEWPRQDTERLEKLRQDFAILPVRLESIADDKSTRITVKCLGMVQKQKPKVHVTFKGKSILKKNVRWEAWPSDAPVLTIQDCEILKEDREAKRLLTIGVNSELNILMLNLL